MPPSMVIFSKNLSDPVQEMTCDCPAQSLTQRDPISNPAYVDAVNTLEDSLTSDATAILDTESSQ